MSRIALRELRLGEEPRVGGEEFAVVSGCEEAGQAVAERVRDAVEQQRRGSRLTTLSAGVVAGGLWLGKDGARQRADVALYEAKRAGKNRVVTAAPS